METSSVGDPPRDGRLTDDPPEFDPFDQIPKLPAVVARWTVRRKAEVVRAVRGGWVPIEEVCELYGISAEELLAWERDLDRHGIPGLRTTRYQIYRNTEKRKD